MSKFATFNIGYLFVAALLGVYGSIFAAFQPTELSQDVAKVLSFAFFPYFLIVGLVFFRRNKDKIMERSIHKLFKNNFRFSLYLYFLYPLTVAFLSYSNYQAISKGFPSIYTGIFSEERALEVAITNKRLWGKRDRNEEVSISGFEQGFPVTRSYYNSVSVGQRVNIGIATSVFGTKIKFNRP